MIEIVGKCGITAKVLAKSRSAVTGAVLGTLELTYPRIIHSEFMTHRMLSKNAASSRAIPFGKMLTQLTARPVRFGQANSGMQDKGEDYYAPVEDWNATNGDTVGPVLAWDTARAEAVKVSKAFYEAGYHKQVTNRLTEPFQMIKVVASGTEWANFFWLRDDSAADPTIRELARVMREAFSAAEAVDLLPGEWHLPYVNWLRGPDGALRWQDEYGAFVPISVEDAIKISCARCAAVSFRNVDYGLEKSREVYARLVGDERKHASAFEHCGTPMKAMYDQCWPDAEYGTGSVNIPFLPSTWEDGVSHMDREEVLWSGNLRGWRQYRKLIKGENYTGRA